MPGLVDEVELTTFQLDINKASSILKEILND